MGGRRGLGVNRARLPGGRGLNPGSAKSFFKIYLSLQNQRLFLPFRDKEKVDPKGVSFNSL